MLKPKGPITPSEIKPQWDTAFAYAGPLPKGISVPANRDQLKAKPTLTKVTPQRVSINPGASARIDRREPGSPPAAPSAKRPAELTSVEKHFEALSYYKRNFLEDFRKTHQVRFPTAVVKANPGEMRAMELFDRRIRKEDPQGVKTMMGEFGATVDFRKANPLTSFMYQEGHSITQDKNKQAAAQYCLHSHRFDPNGPPAPKSDPFSNVGSSRFPSTADYYKSSLIAVNAQDAKQPIPTFLLKNGDDYYKYAPDRTGFVKLDRSRAGV